MSGVFMDIQATVNQIYAEACGNRKSSPQRHLKPSLVYRLLKDEWGVYQDYHGPKHEKVDETTRYERLRMEAGEGFEREVVAKRFPDAVRITGWGPEDLRTTIRAMVQGAPAIAHPQLWWLPDEIYGQADVLVKTPIPSRLGDHSYRVLEFKRSSRLQPYHSLQAGLYNLMLGKIQGRMPDDFDVVLPGGDERVPFTSVQDQLAGLLARWRDLRDGKVRPELPGYDDALPPWRAYSNRILTERQDVTQIAGFTAQGRGKLREAFGTQSIPDLDKLRVEDFQAVFGLVSGIRFYWQAQSYLKREPIRVLPATVRESTPRVAVSSRCRRESTARRMSDGRLEASPPWRGRPAGSFREVAQGQEGPRADSPGFVVPSRGAVWAARSEPRVGVAQA
jgi:predicted RecB family nuclease